MPDAAPGWWGPASIPVGGGARWVLGPLTLWAQRGEREWRIAHRVGDDPMTTALEIAAPIAEDEPPAGAELRRFVCRGTTDDLTLTPLLADRPVVARPSSPVSLLPGEEATLYMSMPVWVRLSSAGSGGELMELPTHRPSDTWVGADTRSGELCYASKTNAHLTLEKVAVRPARVVTPLRVHNAAHDALVFERLVLPTRHLTVYVDRAAQLWTCPVRVTRRAASGAAQVEVAASAPDEAADAVVVSAPRDAPDRNIFERALGALFG